MTMGNKHKMSFLLLFVGQAESVCNKGKWTIDSC